jgi:hypothetical protein
MNAPVVITEFDPLEIDPRPCEWCGLSIDRHVMVDDGEGPEHHCPDPDGLTLDELERRAELVRQIEVAAIVRDMELNDPRDRWRHTGEPRPHAEEIPLAPRRPYCTPQSTVDAFWYVVRLDNAEYMRTWLAQHPLDAPFLLKIWERKNAFA